ncbi:hypothetical protein FRB95_002415 [Tulasnella sp. JGI-2019a]|nr:hypothetical protein FRB95_002415 [Tulasnella sp. JGI-2019a]
MKKDWYWSRRRPLPVLDFLLFTVAQTCPWLDELFPCDARDLVAYNEDVKDALINAWSTGEFATLANYLELNIQSKKPVLLYTGSQENTTVTMNLVDVANEAWQVPFVGETHSVLLNNIDAMKRASNHANFASIIQSSEFGKSRMVDEQAKLVFTILIKLLVIKESQAYPLPDVELSQYLCSQFGEDPIKTTEFYGSFLITLSGCRGGGGRVRWYIPNTQCFSICLAYSS